VESLLSQANEPVEAVKGEQAQFILQHNAQTADANQQLQEVNLSISKLDAVSHSVNE